MRALAERIAGTVIARADARYETARRALLWNDLVPDRGPELIVQVASADDVVEAVRFARGAGLRVAVRGGGHSWCGAPLHDDGMLVDLERLAAVEIDATARVARVRPAVTGRALAGYLEPLGLAFPYGHCPSVALSGYLLSGGLGWNAGTWGPACLGVRAVEVVTADGRLLTATEDEHADLLWAARGGGPGFFGVITRYHLALQPLPRAIVSSTWVHPLAHAAEVMDAAAALAGTLPPAVELVASLAAAPPGLLPGGGWVLLVAATAFVDDDATAAGALAPLAASRVGRACLARDELRPTPFAALFDGTAAVFPERHRYLAEAVWTNAEPREVVAAIAPPFMAAPSPHALVLCALPTGTPRALADAAFSMTARMLVLCYAIWPEARGDAANHAWHRRMTEALQPFVAGHYIGEADLAAPARAERSFSPASWRRLDALRRTWDPDGVFQTWPA